MSEPPIVDYLARLRRRLRWDRRRERVLAEIEDHLRAAAAALQEQGLTAEDATREAIAQLGAPRVALQPLHDRILHPAGGQLSTAGPPLASVLANGAFL